MISLWNMCFEWKSQLLRALEYCWHLKEKNQYGFGTTNVAIWLQQHPILYRFSAQDVGFKHSVSVCKFG